MDFKNALLLVSTLLAVFLQINTKNVTTTSESVKFDPNFSYDQITKNLTNTVNALATLVSSSVRTFELVIANPTPNDLAQTLEKIKLDSQQATKVLAEIKSALGNIQERHTFSNRLTMELARIQAHHLIGALQQMGLQILGVQTALLGGFAKYVFSEPIQMITDFQTNKFVALFEATFEMDKFRALLTSMPRADTKETNQAVHQKLQSIIAQQTVAKTQMAASFSLEVEKARLASTELSLMQRFQIETFIDSINYAIDFIKQYDELHLKLA